jgi:flagellar biosynthesis chaperone FliJ
MAIEAERLNIILAARDREFAKAMDANARRIEKFANKSKKELSGTGKAFAMLGKAAGALSIAAGFALAGKVIDDATKLAKELTNLSNVAGVSTTRFQELAFASKSFGVDQSKLSDILKDVNDKFGDYYTTGAGPLADFFENIAPKIGLTTDAFKGLSSSDALQLYVKSLEDANVSQAEMTFYMEALASDATLLTPLFMNNAAGLDQMAASAHGLGAIIDQDLIEKSTALRDRWDQVVGAMQTKLYTFAMEAGVLFADIFNIGEAEQFIDVNERLAAAKDNLAESEKKLGKLNKDRQPLAVDNVETEIAGFTRQIDNLQAELNRLDEILDARQAQKDALKSLVNAPTKPSSNTKEIDELSKIVSAYEQLAGKLDPIIAAANEYAAAQATVNAAVAAGAITQDQANVTLEMAKQKFEQATGSAVDLSSVYSTLASSMESSMMAMVDGTMSAKDAFKSMASAVIKELFRILVVQQLVNMAMGAFGFTNTGGNWAPTPSGNAAGGPVQAGVPTIAGEHGRELFVPQSNGRIMTVAQTKQMQGGGGGGVVVNQTINVTTGVQQTVRAEIKSLMPQIADNAKAAVLDAKRRGGSYGGGFA